LIVAVFCFLLSLDLSVNSIEYHFTSPVTMSLFIGSIFLFTAFYHVEKFYSAEPFCPPDLVKKREILAPCIVNFFNFTAGMSIIFHIPLFYQAVFRASSTEAGELLIPMILGGMVAGICGGLYIQNTGKYYWLNFACCLALLLGNGIIVTCVIVTDPRLPQRSIIGFMHVGMIIMQAGYGTAVSTTLIALISNVTAAEQAVVTALSYLFRSLGSVLGLSLGAMLVQDGLKRRLLEQLGHGDEVDKIVLRVSRDLDSIREFSPEVAAIVRGSYQGGIADAMFLAMALSFFGWVAGWGLREVRLKK